MKIVFFGSPATSLPSLEKILDAGHHVELVITQPDRPSGRGKQFTPSAVKAFAQDHSLSTYEPERIRKDPEALKKLQGINPDLIVVVAYGQIIPASIIYLPRFNSINLHFSLLPRYRGASPVQWALLEGETQTGLTIFELNEKMDEGDILSQQKIDIFPEETAGELELRLAQEGAELLEKTIDNIEGLRPLPQDHSQATYAPRLTKEDGRMNWQSEAIRLERQVRAFQPWPTSYAYLGERRVKIMKAKSSDAVPHPTSIPGEILSLEKKGIEVCCGERSVLLIQEIQPQDKKPMSAYAFSLGAKIKPKDVFG